MVVPGMGGVKGGWAGWDGMGWGSAGWGGAGALGAHCEGERGMGGWVAGRLRGFSTHSGMGGGVGRSGAGWLGVGWGACSRCSASSGR